MKKLLFFIVFVACLYYGAKYYLKNDGIPGVSWAQKEVKAQKAEVEKKVKEARGSLKTSIPKAVIPEAKVAEQEKKPVASPLLVKVKKYDEDPNAGKQRALKAWRKVLAEVSPFPKLEAAVNPALKMNLNEKNKVDQIENDMSVLIAKYRRAKEKKYLKDAIKAGEEFLAKEEKYIKPATLSTMLFLLATDSIEVKNYPGAKKYLKELKEKTGSRIYEAVAAYGIACMEEVGGGNKSALIEQYKKVTSEYSYKFINEEVASRIKDLE